MPFDNRWNQHTYTSLTLLPSGLWAPVINISKKKKQIQAVAILMILLQMAKGYVDFITA